MDVRRIIVVSICACAWLGVTSKVIRAAGDSFVYPSDRDGVKRVATRTTQRSPVASNNNDPPQVPAHATSAFDPWADMTPNMASTQDPWADMFAQRRQDQYTTTRTTKSDSIYFFDRDDESPFPPRRAQPTTRAQRPRPPARTRVTTLPSTTASTSSMTEDEPCDCQATSEFNPVCGQVANQRVTFRNLSELKCADMCGTEKVELLFHNTCRRTLNVLQTLYSMRHNRTSTV